MTKVAGADADESGSTGPAHAPSPTRADDPRPERGKTVHGEAANAGHRVLAPDDAEVEAYLETALKAPAPERSPDDRPRTACASSTSTRSSCRTTRPMPSWSDAARGRSSCPAARTRSTTPTPRSP